MDLFKDLLIRILFNEIAPVILQGLDMILNERIESTCFLALEKITAAIRNDSLDDFECVEEIVLILEEIGSHGGFRHDFG